MLGNWCKKLVPVFYVTLNRMTKYTWGVCLCFWVVCSLNHRGAESEELNWILGWWEREVLACRFVCDVTHTSASLDTNQRHERMFGCRCHGLSMSRAHTYTHKLHVADSFARIDFCAGSTYTYTCTLFGAERMVLPVTVTVWPKTGSEIRTLNSYLFLRCIFFYVFCQTIVGNSNNKNVWCPFHSHCTHKCNDSNGFIFVWNEGFIDSM